MIIRKAFSIGLLEGILLSLAGLYPAVTLFAPALLPDWQRPITNELLHGLLLMASAAIAVPLFLSVGAMSARYARINCISDGAKVGALTGAIVGLLLYLTLVSPLSALYAYRLLSGYHPSFGMPLPPSDIVLRYAQRFTNNIHLYDVTLFGMAFIGAIQGAVVGYRQRFQPPLDPPPLFQLIQQRRSLHEWFAYRQLSSWAGLLIGGLFAALLFTTIFGQFYVAFSTNWPELQDAVRQSQSGIFLTGPLMQTLPVLWPLISFGFLVYGALVVALDHNPANVFWSRANGIWLATLIILLVLFTLLLRVAYFNLGLMPFGLFKWMQDNPTQAGELPEQVLFFIQTVFFLQRPSTLLSAVLSFPWVVLLLVFLLGILFTTFHSVLYIPLISLFSPRPADRGAYLYRRLQRDPQSVLPMLYGLFLLPHAYEILAHLVIRTRRTHADMSNLLAAYHTLGQSEQTADHLETIYAIEAILSRHPEWHWARDLGATYHALHAVLTAQTLEQILQIEPPPPQQTTSLPPVLVRSVDVISRIITELHKIAQVDDLQSQAIFLDNALSAIHDAQRFVHSEMGNEYFGSTLPEYVALQNVMGHWQGIILEAIRRLKGRADVTAELQTKRCARAATLPLMWHMANRGLNVAQKVRLNLLPSPDYVTAAAEAQVGILSPGESQQVTLNVTPRDGSSRLRVEWEVTYDDAVDADRHLAFADVVEFAVPEKPFQRIFPIPYVTGTPLKTDDVFVGRDDVFAFIKENLLGAHQNNIIILHGQRRTGKTSVLYRLGQMMSDTHVGVLIDMQGKPARGEADFLYSIADDIVFTLEDHGQMVSLPERAEFEQQGPEFFFRSRFLRGVYPHLEGKNLLLMFDEFEELQRRVEDGRLQPEIFQFLRNLMQHEERVDFVFSGTHKLEDLGAEYWSVLFNIAAYKPITFLSPGEVERLMLEPVCQTDVEYDPLSIDRIIHVTAGHPYFTQLVLHEMIVYHNETQRSYLTVADVNQVLTRIVERGEAHFKYIWSESSDDERAVLSSFTELMGGEKPANVEDMRALLLKRGRTSADQWQRALTSLENRDILTRHSARSQNYRFKVDLIRLWIDRKRPSL